MDDSSNRVSVQAAFELCQQYLAWFPAGLRDLECRQREKCTVEFTL